MLSYHPGKVDHGVSRIGRDGGECETFAHLRDDFWGCASVYPAPISAASRVTAAPIDDPCPPTQDCPSPCADG